MKYEETLCLGSLDEWDRDQRFQMGATQQANYLCFTRQRRIGLLTRCSFLNKIKTMQKSKLYVSSNDPECIADIFSFKPCDTRRM